MSKALAGALLSIGLSSAFALHAQTGAAPAAQPQAQARHAPSRRQACIHAAERACGSALGLHPHRSENYGCAASAVECVRGNAAQPSPGRRPAHAGIPCAARAGRHARKAERDCAFGARATAACRVCNAHQRTPRRAAATVCGAVDRAKSDCGRSVGAATPRWPFRPGRVSPRCVAKQERRCGTSTATPISGWRRAASAPAD